LAHREAEVEQARAELERWKQQRQARPIPPTVESITMTLASGSKRLLEFGDEVSTVLERILVGKIRAVPYQLFQSNKVVLRAEFELSLAVIVPDQFAALLAGTSDWQPTRWFPTKTVQVDLFENTLVPNNALMAYELTKYMTLEEAGTLLSMSKRTTHLASQLGKAMVAAGITDPFIRLTSPPENASRWRTRERFFLQDDQRMAG
jgi:hypothetical protein